VIGTATPAKALEVVEHDETIDIPPMPYASSNPLTLPRKR
jgi:uncharacterized transporter YbjL